MIARVSASGGTPVAITALHENEQEQDHYWPRFLPDGRHFLFGVRSRQGEGVRTTVRVASLDDPPGGNGKVLVESGYSAVFAPDPADARAGYLLFVTGTSLMAQAFDPVSRTLSGEARQIVQDIGGAPSCPFLLPVSSPTGTPPKGTGVRRGSTRMARSNRSLNPALPIRGCRRMAAAWRRQNWLSRAETSRVVPMVLAAGAM